VIQRAVQDRERDAPHAASNLVHRIHGGADCSVVVLFCEQSVGVGRDDDAAVTNEDEVDEVGISKVLRIPTSTTHTHARTHAFVHTHSISPTHNRYVSHYHQYNIHGPRFRELT
jgi:hypothetical protein